MNAMVKYQINALSTSEAAMTNEAPMLMVLGQIAKKIAPSAMRISITTQMLVVSARIRDLRPFRTHSAATTHTKIMMRKRGTVLM